MGTAQANRKYPRAGVDQPGVMSFRVGEQRLERRVPVAIRSISCEGVGVSLGGERCSLDRRTVVTMEFKVDSHHFQIPGQVVWTARPGEPGQMDMGVRFQLAMVPSAMRETYARWIVGLLKRHGVQASPPDRP
jgi:hypothetical protein